MTNPLEQYFLNNSGRMISKWSHYFDVYDRHFSRYRNRNPVILEIGVFKGGSLQMWKHYFGKGAEIIGIDTDPRCQAMEEEQIRIFIGSQSDRRFLRELKKKIPKLDILIDDGGHTMEQQVVTFQELYNHVKEDGIYFCEDICTSYQLNYGGGYRRRGTFVEYSKQLIDRLHAWHSEQSSLTPDDFTSSADSLHFYDGILVIEKNNREKPREMKSGGTDEERAGYSVNPTRGQQIRKLFSVVANRFLRALRLRGVWTTPLLFPFRRRQKPRT